jgi:hypothetical protein
MESPERTPRYDVPEPDGPPVLSDAAPSPRPRRLRPAQAIFGVFFIAVVIGGALLALVPWRSADTRNDTLRSGSVPVDTVSVLSLAVGTGLDAQGRAVGGGPALPANAREIDVAVDIAGVNGAVPVTARLFDQRTQTQSDLLPVLVDRDRHLVFTFPRRGRAWEPGRWRASILVNAVEAAYAEFDVR